MDRTTIKITHGMLAVEYTDGTKQLLRLDECHNLQYYNYEQGTGVHDYFDDDNWATYDEDDVTQEDVPGLVEVITKLGGNPYQLLPSYYFQSQL